MPTHPFGAAGFGFPPFATPGFDPSANPFFAAFAPPPPRPAATDPFAWWQAAAQPAPQSPDPTALASQWLGQIHQLASQFVGRDAAPAEVARAWRAVIGDNPFGASGSAAFMPPAFTGFAPGSRGPLDMPAFGYTREHQERLQSLARTGAEFQEAAQAFQAIVGEAGQDAFKRFESLLAKRAEEGKAVESARALFDLWIDAAEDAYADIALGERFQKAFGDYVNAQMRVRAGLQKEVELMCAQWGIPGREEVDAAHKRIAQLERELRRLRRDVERAAGATRPATTATATATANETAAPAAPKPARKPPSAPMPPAPVKGASRRKGARG
ncbi:class III poly(R)-hydroxyalkanoic acid synthase subunit PhaE [Lysobacter humi (ex Lee et al. 2017)]